MWLTLAYLVYQTADGETVVTIVRAVWRVDTGDICVEAVSCSWGSWGIAYTSTRPTASNNTEATYRTVVQVDVPATDEVVKGNLEIAIIFRTGRWVKKLIFINQNLDID